MQAWRTACSCRSSISTARRQSGPFWADLMELSLYNFPRNCQVFLICHLPGQEAMQAPPKMEPEPGSSWFDLRRRLRPLVSSGHVNGHFVQPDIKCCKTSCLAVCARWCLHALAAL